MLCPRASELSLSHSLRTRKVHLGALPCLQTLCPFAGARNQPHQKCQVIRSQAVLGTYRHSRERQVRLGDSRWHFREGRKQRVRRKRWGAQGQKCLCGGWGGGGRKLPEGPPLARARTEDATEGSGVCSSSWPQSSPLPPEGQSGSASLCQLEVGPTLFTELLAQPCSVGSISVRNEVLARREAGRSFWLTRELT